MTTSNTRTSPVPDRSSAEGLSPDDAARRVFADAKLTGIFAHDFNTTLSSMLLRMELLSQDPELSGTAKEDLRQLATEASRARFLARYLMALIGHQRNSKPEALDLTKLIQRVLTRVGPLIGRDATFRFEPSPEAIWIFGETSSAEDLITNLCLLSPHVALRDGELVLKAGLVRVETNEREGNFVCLSLTETWREARTVEVGADETQRYELALLPLEEFARQNHGWVEAEQGGWNGFTIRVFLPTTEPVAYANRDDAAKESGACRETILLVEDEVALRRATALTLRKRGYAVLEASNELEALQLWEKHRGTIDLVLTDQVMPGSRAGSELAKEMRGTKGALEVIVASGRAISDEEQAQFERENMAFLTKPYDAAEVARMVRDSLDRHAQTAD